jgi:hypothetical protein
LAGDGGGSTDGKAGDEECGGETLDLLCSLSLSPSLSLSLSLLSGCRLFRSWPNLPDIWSRRRPDREWVAHLSLSLEK